MLDLYIVPSKMEYGPKRLGRSTCYIVLWIIYLVPLALLLRSTLLRPWFFRYRLLSLSPHPLRSLFLVE